MNIASVFDRATPENRKQAAAFGISVLVHLFIILLIGFLLAFRVPLTITPEEEDTVELTLIDPPPQTQKPKPDYIDSTVMQAAEKPPDNPAFESDRDTVAASALPATGDKPVPTLDGERTEGLELQNREYVAGQKPQQAAPPSAPSQPVSSAPPPQPQATPDQEPKPQPTPPTRPVAQLALPEPPKQQSQPRPTPPEIVKEQDQRPPQPQSKPAPPAAPGFQPQTRVTRIQGSVSNRGRASVAAAATPLGRYKKMISDAIASRWYYYVNEQMSLFNAGTVTISFVVQENGKVSKVRVVNNSSNESFASCSIGAIMEAEIPPMPKELVPMLEGNRIEIDYSFTILR